MDLSNQRSSDNVVFDCMGIRTPVTADEDQVRLALTCHDLLRESRERNPKQTDINTGRWLAENTSMEHRLQNLRRNLSAGAQHLMSGEVDQIEFDDIFASIGGVFGQRTLEQQVNLIAESMPERAAFWYKNPPARQNPE